MLTAQQIKRTLEVAESFYGTSSDPEQIPICVESFNKLMSLGEHTINLISDKKGEPLSWVIVIPTSEQTMDLFMSGTISEQELFNRAVTEKKNEALYLCSAFILPEHRRKGYALKLLSESINRFAPNSEPVFAWIYSGEGQILIKSLEEKLHRKIFGKDGLNFA